MSASPSVIEPNRDLHDNFIRLWRWEHFRFQAAGGGHPFHAANNVNGIGVGIGIGIGIGYILDYQGAARSTSRP